MYTLNAKLRTIDLIEVEMPYVHPFRTSFGEETNKQAILVRIEDENGNIGWGETSVTNSPSYTYETVKTAWHIQEDFLVPTLKKINSNELVIEEIMKELSPVRGHEFAKAGIESALLTLKAQQDDVSLGKLYGSTKSQIPTGVSVGIQPTIEGLVERVGKFIEQGYKRIKIKIEPGWDVEPLTRLRDEYGDIPLMVDANSAYTLEDLPILKEIDSFGLTMIEQPMAYNDILEHKKLQDEMKTAVCLDEPIHSVRDALMSIEHGCAKIINIKPARVGGYLNAIEIAKQLGQGVVWCGGMLETGIGRIHNVFLQARSEFIIPGDTSGSDRYYATDIIEPAVTVESDGVIKVPAGVGLVHSVSEQLITGYSLRRTSFRL